MAFQLILHPDSQVTYIPKLDAGRDKDLLEVLMEPYDDQMRFAYAQVRCEPEASASLRGEHSAAREHSFGWN